ncbi:MAG: hypothetical protein IIA45_10655 [Bacteroidetes bacterium]|nr:hypothetical protein [Bacteroidota bacterium]
MRLSGITQYTTAFILLGVILYLLVKPSLYSPYSFIDEPYIVKFTEPHLGYFDKYESNEAYLNVGTFIKKYQNEQGRFQPLSVLIPWSLTKLSGGNPFFLRVSALLCGVVIGFLFFVFMRALKVSFMLSLLGAAILLTGRYDEIFWRLGPSEILGLFFMMISLCAMLMEIRTNRTVWKIILVLGILCMSWSKESFLIMVPVMSLIYLLLYKYEKGGSIPDGFQSKRWMHIFIWACFLFGTGAIIFVRSQMGGTYLSNSTFPKGELFLNNLISFINPLLLWLPVLVYVVITLVKRKTNSNVLPLIAVFIVWIGSQLLIYKDILVVDSVRYLMPAQLFLIALAVLSVSQLKIHLPGFYKYLFTGFLGLFFLQNAKNMSINSSYFGARSSLYHEMLDAVAEADPGRITIAASPYQNFEFIASSALFLSQRGINVPIAYSVLEDVSEGEPDIYRRYTQSLKNINHGLNPGFIEQSHKQMNKESDLIISAFTLEEAEYLQGIAKAGYQVNLLDTTYFYLSTKELLKGNFEDWKFPKRWITYRFHSR